MECKRHQSSSGFTLIEVALSVAILGIALTTLVALQSSYLRSYTYERNLVRASLVGQYLLATWEADDNLPTPGESTKPLLPVLEKLGYFEENEQMSKAQTDFDGWMLHRNVTNVGIPPLENALRKLQLEIIWGPGSNEMFSIVYFLKGAKLPEATDDDASDDTTVDEETPSDEQGTEQDQ